MIYSGKIDFINIELNHTLPIGYRSFIRRLLKPAGTYGAPGLPSTYFVNPQGTIVKVFVGWLKTEDIFRTIDLIERQRSRDRQTG